MIDSIVMQAMVLHRLVSAYSLLTLLNVESAGVHNHCRYSIVTTYRRLRPLNPPVTNGGPKRADGTGALNPRGEWVASV
jgi:hypothetical protein